MGGGEWLEQRQQQQVQQVQKAYAKVNKKKESSIDVFESIEVDGIDQAYAWARTFTPSWVMGLIFIAGILALAPKVLGKFGFSFKFERNRSR